MADAPDATPSPESAGLPQRAAGLGRNTAIMASGTLASRLLGFVRNGMLVAAISVNAGAASAYDIANKLPNVLYAVLAAGVINAALVPQIVKAFQRPGGTRTVDRILTVGTVISFGITVALTIAAPILVWLYSPTSWPPELTALATAFALWCIPQLFFYAIYTLFGQVLNAKEQFGPFMWAPVLNNVIGIAGLGVYLAIFGPYMLGADNLTGQALTLSWTPFRIGLLAGVATLGIAAQALILIWPMLRGGYRFHWVWRGPKGELAAVRTVVTWALGAVLIEQVGVLWATRVAAAASAAAAEVSANPGQLDPAIAGNFAYFNALLIYLLPHSLITVSIVTALTTSMSRFASADDMPGLRGEFSRGVRTIGVFTVFATAVLIVLAPSLTRIIAPTSLPVEVTSISYIVIAFAIGLVPLGAMVLMKRVYFVLEDARSIFFIHIPMTIVWIAIASLSRELLNPMWWVVGVAFGMSMSNVTGVVLRARGMHRRLGGLDGRRVAKTHAKAIVGALAAGAAGWAVSKALPDPVALVDAAGLTAGLLNVALVGTVMAIVYGGVLWLLRTPELNEVMSPVTRLLRRRVR